MTRRGHARQGADRGQRREPRRAAGQRERHRDAGQDPEPRRAGGPGEQVVGQRGRRDPSRGGECLHGGGQRGEAQGEDARVVGERARPRRRPVGVDARPGRSGPQGWRHQPALAAAADQGLDEQRAREQQQRQVQPRADGRAHPAAPGERALLQRRGPAHRRPHAEPERALERMAVIGGDRSPLHPVGPAGQGRAGREHQPPAIHQPLAGGHHAIPRPVIEPGLAQRRVQRLREDQHDPGGRILQALAGRRRRPAQRRVSQDGGGAGAQRDQRRRQRDEDEADEAAHGHGTRRAGDTAAC
jgi:hypothetical protein